MAETLTREGLRSVYRNLLVAKKLSVWPYSKKFTRLMRRLTRQLKHHN